MSEVKEIKGFTMYYASSEGHIISRKYNKERILKRYIDKHGRSYVCLSMHGKYKKYNVARLIAKTFIDNPENKPQVNHIDGDKLNNNVSNLEWNTASENITHAYRTGLLKIKHFKIHPDQYQSVIDMYNSGKNVETISKLFSVHRNTIYNILNKYRG